MKGSWGKSADPCQAVWLPLLSWLLLALLPHPPQLLHDPQPGFLASAGRTAPRRRRRLDGSQYHSAYSVAAVTMAATAQSCAFMCIQALPIHASASL